MEINKLFELQKVLLSKYNMLVNPYYEDSWYVDVTNISDKCDSSDRLIYDSYESEKIPITFDNYKEALEFGINKYYKIIYEK